MIWTVLAYGLGALFGLLLLLFVVGMVRLRIRSTYTMTQCVLWIVAKVLSRVLWRVHIEGQFPALAGTGAVVIANHRSSVDPFFIQTVMDHVIHWMVAREYVNHPLFGWFLRQTEAIPVNRSGIDTAATKLAIRIVEKGGVVGMFPEGRINRSQQLMQSVRPGAIVVALRGHGQIVPCYIEGSPYAGTAWSPFLMRARVRVRFGQPIDLSAYLDRVNDSQVARELLTKCVKEIATLADQPDFEPTIAGRNWKQDN